MTESIFRPIFVLMKKNLKNISLYVDLIFCLLILPLVLMVVPVEKWIVNQADFLVILVVFLYFVYFVYRKANIPSLFMRRKYLRIVLILAALVLLTLAVSNIPVHESQTSRLTYTFRQNLRKQTVWFFFLTVSGFSMAVTLIFELFRQILDKQQIEAEKNKAELALYKSQIDPHFLFNTLNAIYALVVTGSEKAESALVKFSGLLKYVYSYRKADTIDLGTEISYISQYIELQELRLNRHTRVEWTCDVADYSLMVPSMVLITFVENAFKYGVSADEDCCISLLVRSDGSDLHFESENSIMNRTVTESSSVGIENCRRRLELMYQDRFTLDVSEKDGRFRAVLDIMIR